MSLCSRRPGEYHSNQPLSWLFLKETDCNVYSMYFHLKPVLRKWFSLCCVTYISCVDWFSGNFLVGTTALHHRLIQVQIIFFGFPLTRFISLSDMAVSTVLGRSGSGSWVATMKARAYTCLKVVFPLSQTALTVIVHFRFSEEVTLIGSSTHRIHKLPLS